MNDETSGNRGTSRSDGVGADDESDPSPSQPAVATGRARAAAQLSAQLGIGVADLAAVTERLVAVRSESFDEKVLCDVIEAFLRSLPHLEVTRVGDNVVARTTGSGEERLILAGHTDTVPANDNAVPQFDGSWLWGLGTADMKGGLAVMLRSAAEHAGANLELTYVFYAREEVAAEHSGLAEVLRTAPGLLAGDAAILGEPTDGAIEAGCQGSVRLRVTLAGVRAHTARAWMGVNAIHRAAPLIAAVVAVGERRPVIEGCEFRESTQVVSVTGGVADNVVPDRVEVTIAHRFAPDRSLRDAENWLRHLVEPHLADGDSVAVVDTAPAAWPGIDHALLSELRQCSGAEVSAKLGWTDVARFAEVGIPAVNFGPGDARCAHMSDERVSVESLDRVWLAIDRLVRRDVRAATEAQ